MIRIMSGRYAEIDTLRTKEEELQVFHGTLHPMILQWNSQALDC